jgi:hypothetical protein
MTVAHPMLLAALLIFVTAARSEAARPSVTAVEIPPPTRSFE